MTKKTVHRKRSSSTIKESIRKISQSVRKGLLIQMNSNVFLLKKMKKENHLVLFLKNVDLI